MAKTYRLTLLLAALAAAQAYAPGWSGGQAAVAAPAAKARPHIDLAFCIDTTGSMQSEIDNVKAKTKEIVAKLSAGQPSPVIRVGLVAYRDRGDDYVTKIFPFSQDIDGVVKNISDLKADGGGDQPESVNEALHVSVHDLKWSSDKKTVKLLFLIGDAGPHFYPNDYDWHSEAKQAIADGIEINTIGCQGLETMPASQGIDVWKGIARLADGKYQPLSYRHEIADVNGKKTTVVASGGRLYSVAEGAAGAWRDGAASLAAKGLAREVSAAALPMAAPAGERAFAGYGFGVAAARPLSGSYSAMDKLSGRQENNLTDLVLDATRDAAKKKLNIDFK